MQALFDFLRRHRRLELSFDVRGDSYVVSPILTVRMREDCGTGRQIVWRMTEESLPFLSTVLEDMRERLEFFHQPKPKCTFGMGFAGGCDLDAEHPGPHAMVSHGQT